jgi:mannosylglucosylglycerate synthase
MYQEIFLKCQGGELNSRPRAYESPALPLSYPGSEEAKEVDTKTDWYRCKVNSGISIHLQTLVRMKIGLVHYTSWPVVGGVEAVLRQQATLMNHAGHSVSIICGDGKRFSDAIPTLVFPELNLREELVIQAQQEITTGYPGAAYFRAVNGVKKRLGSLFAEWDCTVVHNFMTMPFHLAATQVISGLAEEGNRVLAWTHDLAANNQDYSLPRNRVFDMIRERQPGIEYVVISETRAQEFRDLTGTSVDAVVPNGLDLSAALDLTPEVSGLLAGINSEEAILLYPTRILQRKNLGLALQILAALREIGFPAWLFVTGAANGYNPGANAHFAGLKQLASELGVTDQLCWVNEHFFVDDAQLRSLYLAGDALLFTTKQEGFGLPILEAAAFRLPIFCSDIEPLRSNLPPGSIAFDLRSSPRNISLAIAESLKQDRGFLSRKLILQRHAARDLYRAKIEPLLQTKI